MSSIQQRWSALLGWYDYAHISDCGNYRTLLWRTFRGNEHKPPLVFCMLNPSTADALHDDATIRRCIGFALRETAGGIVVVNLSPWRATDPLTLNMAYENGKDVLWRDENYLAFSIAADLGPVVLAWGSGIRSWMEPAARMIRQVAKNKFCLGLTKCGEPRHPLMLPKNAPLMEFP